MSWTLGNCDNFSVGELVGGVSEIVFCELVRTEKLVENIKSKCGHLPLWERERERGGR